jgi:hypothetical protein
MLGSIWCRLWAHKWTYVFTNGRDRAVFGCQRCMKVASDK